MHVVLNLGDQNRQLGVPNQLIWAIMPAPGTLNAPPMHVLDLGDQNRQLGVPNQLKRVIMPAPGTL